MNYPTNTDDVIDSRQVIEALEDLAKLHQPGPVELDGWLDGHPAVRFAQDDLFAHERALLKLAEQAADYCEDWRYGATLVRDSYFVEYAQELADDIGFGFVKVGSNDRTDVRNVWPFTCIDWEQAARELRMDYTSVDFDGVTYWVR